MDINNAKTIQSEFLKKIEDTIPKNTSLVNELSDLLNISTDSIYRRMRLETFLTLEEIIILSNHFKVSFDTYNSVSENVTFSYSKMESSVDSFYKYLSKLVKDLEIINQSKEKQIIYACEDIPIFHHYRHPILASFKMFYWVNAILSIAEFENEKFDSEVIPNELQELGQKAIDLYTNIPSIEIWTETTIQSSVKQIEYLWESGKFKSISDVLAVCNALKEEINLVKKQAENGTKIFCNQNTDDDNSNNYKLYYSDLEITNNCVLVQLGNTKSVYLGHFTFNTMSTFNDSYGKETLNWLNIIMRKSVLISGVSEKIRYQIFRKYLKQIEDLETRINSKE